MKKIATFLSLVFFLMTAYADFELEKKEIQIAIKEVLQKDGVATLEDAEKFWKRIPKNKEAEKAMNLLANEYGLAINQLQYEMWSCTKKAWIEKKTNECKNARNSISNIESKLGKENYNSTKNLEQMSVLINASARNQEYIKNGDIEYSLSLDTINKTISRIEQATNNLKYVIKNKQ